MTCQWSLNLEVYPVFQNSFQLDFLHKRTLCFNTETSRLLLTGLNPVQVHYCIYFSPGCTLPRACAHSVGATIASCAPTDAPDQSALWKAYFFWALMNNCLLTSSVWWTFPVFDPKWKLLVLLLTSVPFVNHLFSWTCFLRIYSDTK